MGVFFPNFSDNFSFDDPIARLSVQLDEARRTGAKHLDVTDQAEAVARLLSTAVSHDRFGDDRKTSAARALMQQCYLVSRRLGPAVPVDRPAAAAFDPRISLRQTIRLIASATRAYREAGGKDKNVSALHEIVKRGRVGPEKAEESLTFLKNAREELALTDPEYKLFDGALKAIWRRLPTETLLDSSDFFGLILRGGHGLVGPDAVRSVLSSDHGGFYYAKAQRWTERGSPVILRVERTLANMVAYARELRDSRFLREMRHAIYDGHPALHLRERRTVTLDDVFSASSERPWFTDALVKFSGHPRVRSHPAVASVATAMPVVKRPRNDGFFGQADVTDPSVREAVDEEMVSRREGAQRRALVLRAQRVAMTWGLGEAAVTLGRLDETQLDRLLRGKVKRPDGRNFGPDERLALTVAIHHPDASTRTAAKEILTGSPASTIGRPGIPTAVPGAAVTNLYARPVTVLPVR